MDGSDILIIGANGQLGTALKQKYPYAKSADIEELDITDQKSVEDFDWSGINTIINAAAYTNVDGAETLDGRRTAWLVNAVAVSYLLKVAEANNITLVHISTDYVFDGTKSPHNENETFAPLSSYGASKAAGDILINVSPKHYLLRTSWVIGEGGNFVRTMLKLGQKSINPSVVADQVGRLTFTSELVKSINHLLSSQSEYGTYNLSNDGDPVSWAEITREIFKLANLSNRVTDITSDEYYKDKPQAAARPLNSTLDLTKIKATGLALNDWRDNLVAYIKKELKT